MDKSFTVRPITCIYKTDKLPFQAHFYFIFLSSLANEVFEKVLLYFLRKFCSHTSDQMPHNKKMTKSKHEIMYHTEIIAMG